jgi:hypothetical protein
VAWRAVGEDSTDGVGLGQDAADELRLVAATHEQMLGALVQEAAAALDREAGTRHRT